MLGRMVDFCPEAFRPDRTYRFRGFDSSGYGSGSAVRKHLTSVNAVRDVPCSQRRNPGNRVVITIGVQDLELIAHAAHGDQAVHTGSDRHASLTSVSVQ